ncbi:MAG: TolC family protein [Rubinisphaera brasiliensis]|uniref:TolC family protein n=1 Tax=Rubinisphaera brasiliensis TaxID=119 RepID=UPI00391C3A2F
MPLPLPASPVSATAEVIHVPSPAESRMTMADVEQIALGNNPTLKQAEALIARARGARVQVQQPANPTVGYFASQLADEGTDQQGLFFEQQFVRGGKLKLNARVLDRTTQYQIWQLEAQRLRVLTDVRVLYYEASAAQEKLNAADGFVEMTQKATELSKLRFEAAEDSRIDLLQTRIQLNEVQLLRRQAEIQFTTSWDELAALTGVPYVQPGLIATAPRVAPETIDWAGMYESIQVSSPELAASQQKVSRARSLLDRQKVQTIPNVTMALGTGYDHATDAGMLNLQLAGALPIRNRNEGNISAAYAEMAEASHDVERVRGELKARLARVSRDYDSARAAVELYDNEIVPQTREALDLATSSYEAGELDFLQLLVVRRAYFDAKLASIEANKQLGQAQARIDGQLLSGALTAPDRLDATDDLRGQSLSGE